MPMQPSPTAETCGPLRPRRSVCMHLPRGWLSFRPTEVHRPQIGKSRMRELELSQHRGAWLGGVFSGRFGKDGGHVIETTRRNVDFWRVHGNVAVAHAARQI